MLAIAAVAAIASMFFVPPDGKYLTYFDWRTIGCLFCVLAVAAAFRLMGAFGYLARTVVGHFSRPVMVALMLVLVTAAVSMVATNDVALIVMLPLSAAIAVRAGWVRLLPALFALQALAANLCGMITPFGSPHNLYLYSYYHLELGEFLATMALPFAVSVAGIVAATVLLAHRLGRTPESTPPSKEVSCAGCEGQRNTKSADASDDPLPETSSASAVRIHHLSFRRLSAYGVLLVLTMLAVFRVVPVAVAVVVVAVALALLDRRALRAVDYPLLLTFVCFFVFAGNLARLPWLAEALGGHMESWGLLISAGASQIISNVPAAVLLSHFTTAWQPLLIGVNIGGAGTFVGSLASLIAIQHFTSARKIYPALRTDGAPTTGAFLLQFAALNFAFQMLLLIICQVAGF